MITVCTPDHGPIKILYFSIFIMLFVTYLVFSICMYFFLYFTVTHG